VIVTAHRPAKYSWGALLIGALAALGCASRSAARPPAATTATAPQAVTAPKGLEDADAYALREHHRYHHGGETLFLAMSLETLGVSPQQREAVEKIRTDLRGAMEPLRAAEHQLLVALADDLARGVPDPPRANAAVLEVSYAAATAHDASIAALNALHAVLTAPQRAALADKVESNWAVWRAENIEERDATTGAARGHLAALSTELDLSPEQQQEIRATLAEQGGAARPLDRERAAARLHALAEAFRAQQFDARAVDREHPAAGLAGWGAAHLARVVAAMGPVLTTDQRARLAQKLINHATHAGSAEGST
jgi:Spy/CpxP family protein refolding chaperone